MIITRYDQLQDALYGRWSHAHWTVADPEDREHVEAWTKQKRPDFATWLTANIRGEKSTEHLARCINRNRIDLSYEWLVIAYAELFADKIVVECVRRLEPHIRLLITVR